MILSELRELVVDREAWDAAIQGISKSRIRLRDWTELNWVMITSLSLPLTCLTDAKRSQFMLEKLDWYQYRILMPIAVLVCMCYLLETKPILITWQSGINPGLFLQPDKWRQPWTGKAVKICSLVHNSLGFPSGSYSKESTCNEGGLGLIPGLGRFPWRRE